MAFDQIVNMAANLRYMSGGQLKVPMVIRAPTGAGMQLAATHSQSFETWLAEVPGMRVVAPSTPYDALGLLRTAIKEDNPVVYAESAGLYGVRGEVPEEHYEVELGSAKVRREGEAKLRWCRTGMACPYWTRWPTRLRAGASRRKWSTSGRLTPSTTTR